MENGWRITQLLEGDADAEYAAVIDIDLNEIKEADPVRRTITSDARLLSDVANSKIDEVFIGSCMTNISHFRAAGSCWISTRASYRPVCGWRRQPRWMRLS